MFRKTLIATVILMTIISGMGLAAEETGLAGDWKGKIDLPEQQIVIKVHFTESDGMIEGKIDIPQQLANNIPLREVKVEENNKVSFVLPVNPAGNFSGELKDDLITGSFNQGPYQGTFTLNREQGVKKVEEIEKSCGSTEEVVLNTSTGGIYGTLTLPEKEDKIPVVLIIPGSGPTDRDGNNPLAGNSDTYKKIARSLQKEGIAALRYDKRSVAASKDAGKNGMVFGDFIQDAVGWLKKLKAEQRFNKVVVMGHSQGSLIGIVAAEKAKVSGYISLEGTGRNIADVLLDQLSGLPDGLYQEAKDIIGSLRQGKKVPEVSEGLKNYLAPSIQDFLISWFSYDPAEEIKKLNIPALFIQGSTDLQAYPEDFKSLVKSYPRAESRLFTGMNHVLRKAPADRQENLMTYSNPDLPLFPGLMEEITEFINQV